MFGIVLVSTLFFMPVFPSFVLIDTLDEAWRPAMAARLGRPGPAAALLRARLPGQRGADPAHGAGLGRHPLGRPAAHETGPLGRPQQCLLRQVAGQPYPGVEHERPARHLRDRVRSLLVPPAGRAGRA
ncbi:hypothetical protein LP419_40920 [Massilia sp. H-1]|nr:hypothetical protein LP419_40920 [Massilia sp. H-1]